MRWLYIFLVLIALLLPLSGSGYAVRIATLFMIYVIAALGLNLIIGYTGQVSLAQGAFYGLGAYVTALVMLNGYHFVLALILTVIFVGIIALLIGLMTLRLRGAYFAIATLVFNVIIYEIVDKWEEVTRGPRGLFGIPPLKMELGGTLVTLSSGANFYYLMLGVLALMTLIYWFLVKSSFGTVIVAIRENELLAEFAGINLTKYKVTSFVLSAIFAGVAGSFYAVYIGSIFPEIASYVNSFAFLIAILFGGAGTLLGPFVGTALVTSINEAFFTFAQYTVLVQGIVFLLTVLFLPKGVMGTYYTKRAEKGRRLPEDAVVGKL